ncbi:MAG: hypothetical protein ACTSWK_00430 [Promethearchaeota archaeon]
MKVKRVIEIKTENYLEEAYILENFPQAVWFSCPGNTMFYLPEYLEDEINTAILKECWINRKEK